MCNRAQNVAVLTISPLFGPVVDWQAVEFAAYAVGMGCFPGEEMQFFERLAAQIPRDDKRHAASFWCRLKSRARFGATNGKFFLPDERGLSLTTKISSRTEEESRGLTSEQAKWCEDGTF